MTWLTALDALLQLAFGSEALQTLTEQWSTPHLGVRIVLRLFVALVETHQQADGSIAVPEILQPYLRTSRIAK